MAAHQAPLSLGFSRQEHWSGLSFPSPKHESEKWKWSRSVMSDSLRPHGLQPTRLLHPRDFPGKSARGGRQCLLRNWLQTRAACCCWVREEILLVPADPRKLQWRAWAWMSSLHSFPTPALNKHSLIHLHTHDVLGELHWPHNACISDLEQLAQLRSTEDFPSDSDGKESVCTVRDSGLIPGWGRSLGEENGYPLQYSCLENSMDRGAW